MTTTTGVTAFVEVAATDAQRAVLDRLARANRLALGGVPLIGKAERRAGFALVEQGLAGVEGGLFFLTLPGRLVAFLLRAGQDWAETETENEGG